jgi:hypothetical protein
MTRHDKPRVLRCVEEDTVLMCTQKFKIWLPIQVRQDSFISWSAEIHKLVFTLMDFVSDLYSLF